MTNDIRLVLVTEGPGLDLINMTRLLRKLPSADARLQQMDDLAWAAKFELP